MPEYGDVSFWETRYKDLDPLSPTPIFDWYNNYDAMKPVLVSLITRKEASILHVGCGNSELPERLYDDGYRRVVSIDVSPAVVRFMAKRNKERRPELRFDACDVTDLSEFNDDDFDVVIDKGTLDSIVCGRDAMRNAKAMCAEVRGRKRCHETSLTDDHIAIPRAHCASTVAPCAEIVRLNIDRVRLGSSSANPADACLGIARATSGRKLRVHELRRSEGPTELPDARRA